MMEEEEERVYSKMLRGDGEGKLNDRHMRREEEERGGGKTFIDKTGGW